MIGLGVFNDKCVVLLKIPHSEIHLDLEVIFPSKIYYQLHIVEMSRLYCGVFFILFSNMINVPYLDVEEKNNDGII